MNKTGNAEKSERKRLPCWSIPVTEGLDNLVEEAVAHDTHVSKSDLIRDAVREKLQRMGVNYAPRQEGSERTVPGKTT